MNSCCEAFKNIGIMNLPSVKMYETILLFRTTKSKLLPNQDNHPNIAQENLVTLGENNNRQGGNYLT